MFLLDNISGEVGALIFFFFYDMSDIDDDKSGDHIALVLDDKSGDSPTHLLEEDW